jgi:hypothetical protein
VKTLKRKIWKATMLRSALLKRYFSILPSDSHSSTQLHMLTPTTYMMSTLDDNMMEIDGLTKLLSNVEVDANGSNGQIHHLTERLACVFVDNKDPDAAQLPDQPVSPTRTEGIALDNIESDDFKYPPGTTLEEQLLILAGVEDYHLPRSHSDSYPSFANNNVFTPSNPYPMAELLATPPQFEPLPLTPPTPSFPSSGEVSYWTSVRCAVKKKYGWMTAYKREELAYASLPDNEHELAELCALMSEELEDRWLQFGALPVLAPKAHVWYPYWAPGHPINSMIDQVKGETAGTDNDMEGNRREVFCEDEEMES